MNTERRDHSTLRDVDGQTERLKPSSRNGTQDWEEYPDSKQLKSQTSREMTNIDSPLKVRGV